MCAKMTDPVPGRKWNCEYCTYENFPAAKKCTLCRAPKPPQFISDESPKVEQDIYKLAPLIQPDPSSNDGNVSPTTSTQPGSKWSCQVCTYLNWPKAQKCVQCVTARPKVVPVFTTPTITSPSPSSSQEHIKPLSINVNIAEAASSGSGSRRSSPRTSPNSPEAAKAINNDKNRAVAAMSNKWICKACTYENWPRALKCVLCGLTRGKSKSDLILPSGSEGAEGGIASNKSTTNTKRHSPPLITRSPDSLEQLHGATASASTHIYQQEKQDKNRSEERKLRQIRNRMKDSDWLWLNACRGVVEGDSPAVEAFIASGGDPARQLTQEETVLLNRPSAFQVGYTLIHLAIRFQREDMLTVLLTASDVAAKAKKRVPSHVSPDIASDLLRQISASIRQRKGDFPCYFLTEITTFALPADIEDLPRPVQKQLFDELLDRDVQKELEVEEPIINWSIEITERFGSRLYALWNRTAGDCLLDSVFQATWGVFDRDNALRRAMADSLAEGVTYFYPRWKETETLQAQSLHFSLDENQWQQDWAILLSLASQPGASLEQIHIFALAHILRRPIIVYGIKFVKSFRGENIGLARFQGVYLPLLWESSFCWKTPIALAYTRGHFSALVPMEVDTDENMGAGANLDNSDESQTAYLPLMDSEGKLLPLHFLVGAELGREETLLREWMDCCVTDGGLLVAQMKLRKRPLLVKQMLDEWLDRYRRLAHMVQSRAAHSSQGMSSDGDTDDE